MTRGLRTPGALAPVHGTLADAVRAEPGAAALAMPGGAALATSGGAALAMPRVLA
jgi:hypothetical protein